MADLDDFFAKKDKKKSKVKKFTASELLTSSKHQGGEDVAVPVQRRPVEKRREEVADVGEHFVDSTTAVETVRQKASGDQEEDEWGEFEQEKERDYSGLKIQKLQIQDYEEEEDEEDAEHELNEEGELVKREPSGPWAKINTQPAPQPAKQKAPMENLPNTAGGVYIPPSMRNKPVGGASSAASSRSRAGKKEKGAPDLNNEEFFPTLSAAVAIEQHNAKMKKFEQTERGFTEAKPSKSHSNRYATAPGDEGPRLSLGNKFNALATDD